MMFKKGEVSSNRCPTAKNIAIIAVIILLIPIVLPWNLVGAKNKIQKPDPHSLFNPPKLIPNGFEDLSYFRNAGYKNYSLEVWRNAVRIPTQSYEDFGEPGVDPRLEVFTDFENYLLNTFTNVANNSQLDHVYGHGLIFNIEGSNKDLKPLMLTAHQDVNAVFNESIPLWTHDPFEGYFDGRFLWGRGSSDCKNNLVGIFEALELLFVNGFKPKRNIVLAFGFDEESYGRLGALKMKYFLVDKYGENSMFLLLDEGGLGVQDLYGTRFALPSVGEKGYVDIEISLRTSGGHSSVPPRHTSVGIMSEIVYQLESHPYDLDVTSENPYFSQLQYQAEYGKLMDEALKHDILSMGFDSKAKRRVLELLDKSMITRSLSGTSQAIDIFQGGLKVNALPEKVVIKINYRIAYESSVEEVKSNISKVVQEVAIKYNLNVSDFGEMSSDEFDEFPIGGFYLRSDSELNPAPVTNIFANPTWDLVAGTTRQVFEDFAIYPDSNLAYDSEVIVSPSVMTGNTDTRHYWELSNNIYRFTPVRHFSRMNAHAIDERIDLDAHVETVAFYHQFILNVDNYETN